MGNHRPFLVVSPHAASVGDASRLGYITVSPAKSGLVRMTPRRAALLVVPFLAACSGATLPNATGYNDPRYRGPGFGTVDPAGGAIFSTAHVKGDTSGDGGGGGLGVNAYLWRGALDTLSFMPLVNADPLGGVIVTDWYQPVGGNGERFKATAYILDRQLRADGLRVTIFRQVQQDGQWVDAPVAPSTTGEIEDKVLARARELRAQSASS